MKIVTLNIVGWTQHPVMAALLQDPTWTGNGMLERWTFAFGMKVIIHHKPKHARDPMHDDSLALFLTNRDISTHRNCRWSGCLLRPSLDLDPAVPLVIEVFNELRKMCAAKAACFMYVLDGGAIGEYQPVFDDIENRMSVLQVLGLSYEFGTYRLGARILCYTMVT